MNSNAQLTLTVDDGKILIAYAVINSEIYKKALNNKILFKGSTTVSALTELELNTPLRICGRMSENGMKSNKIPSNASHWLLYENGKLTNCDENIEEVIKTLSKEDLFITGANAIDTYNNAALLIGSEGGGGYGRVLGYTYTEGFKTLILATTDKLVMGNINELYGEVNRKTCDYSYGMGCGLLPVVGKIITEKDAIEMLGDVDALVFARGGIGEAKGGSAIAISGDEAEVVRVLEIIEKIKSMKFDMGDKDSLVECSFPCESCGRHLSCKYANKNKIYKKAIRKV